MLRLRMNALHRIRRRFSTIGSESQPSSPTPAAQSSSQGSRFRFRYALIAASPIAGWYYLDWQAQKESISEMQEYVVSTGVFELSEMIKRSDVSAQKMREVHENSENAFSGAKWISCDQFGKFLKQDSESRELDEWDIHPLMRNAPTKRKGMGRNVQTLVDLSECLIGSSMMISQSEPAKERAYLAWKIVDSDGDGVLNFFEFKDLLEKMMRTGHFLGKTLIRRTEYLPPHYEILSPLGLGQEIFKVLGMEFPNEDTPIQELQTKYKISWDQFSELMESNKMKKKGQIWYYDPEMFKLRKDKEPEESKKSQEKENEEEKETSKEEEEKQ